MDKRLLTIDISHGTTHDGPGMRTTVFVKGCPLHCLWCHNPESIGIQNETWWTAQDCIGCDSCIQACPQGAISWSEEKLRTDRSRCERCGSCVEACPTNAMSWQGKEYDLETLLEEVLRDKNYYRQFGGGVTCSGGEPLLQHEFVAELFRRLQAEGISTALDTCGFAPRSNLEHVLPWTNYVLYDMKLIQSDRHKQFTGAPNERILDNLCYTAEYVRRAEHPIRIWIRTPLIPGITTEPENIRGIGAFISEHLLDVVERWELCAFNGVCAAKYDKLGAVWPFAGKGAMSETEIDLIRQAAYTVVPKENVIVTGMIRAAVEDNQA